MLKKLIIKGPFGVFLSPCYPKYMRANTLHYPILANPRSQCYRNDALPTHPPQASASSTLKGGSGSKRKASQAENPSADESPSKKRSQRTCAKCGLGEGCKGNKSVKLCKNACQDCGSMSCEGQNSRNKETKCSNSHGA